MLFPSDIVAKKQKGEKVSMITAYDFAFAQMAEAAGVDQILVGASPTRCSATRAPAKSA